MQFLLLISNLIAIPILSPIVLGIVRATKARMQSRRGASIFQPYRDLMKLFAKDEVVSEDNSWIFSIAPYIVFGTTLAIAAGVPLASHVAFAPMGDVLVFAYTLAGGAFFLALAGMDTGGGFGGFGASREMMIASLTEGGLILSLVAVAFIANTTNLAAMTQSLPSLPLVAMLPLAIAGIAFFIALLAENARYPVDNPATHLELTMVHEAMLLEYSGPRLALMEWAASNKLLIFMAVFVDLFLPFGVPVNVTMSTIIVSFLIFAAKILLLAVAVACIESVIPKFRIFRVPDLLFTSFVLSVIAIVIIVL